MNVIKEKLNELPIRELAKSTKFEKREPKKISSEAYVHSFVQCVLNGNISQASWSKELSKLLGEPVSEQALQDKVQFRHVEFSEKLLEAAMGHTLKNNIGHDCCEILSRFKSIRLHDSTCVKLPAGLMDFFPGSKSRNGSNAMARIQLSMDLLTNSYCKVAINSFRENDQSYGLELAKNAKEGELHLFDLGYFQKELLRQFDKKGASYLCRYFDVCLFKRDNKDPEAKAIDMVKSLKSLDEQGITTLDRELDMGRKERIPVRMVAVKLPQKIAQQRRRKSQQKRKQDGRKAYDKNYIYLLGWNIYFTNIPASILSAKEAFRIYGLRWRIEIIFKAWKSKFDFTRMFAKQYYGLPSRASIQINLILMTLVMFVTKWYQHLFHLVQAKTGRFLSLFKFCDMIKNSLGYLHHLYNQDQDKLLDVLVRQYCYDKRKDRLNFIEILYDRKLT